MTDRFRVIPAAYVYLAKDGAAGTEVLLHKRRGTGFMDGHWAAAAGHVERGETPQQAARREVGEELGVQVGDLEFLTTMQRTGNDLPIDERVDFFFACRWWSGDPSIQEPEKCSALEWFGLEYLPEPVVPHELAVLTAWAQDQLPPLTTFGFE